ncbi:MAG: methyltransferase [Elusimicrobia bacterium]|nr:methyltransferase [Candidatus Liberimonas magnetica]
MNRFCYDPFSFPRKYVRAVYNKMFHKRLRLRAGRTACVTIKGTRFNIDEGVFNPLLFMTGKPYAIMLDKVLKEGSRGSVLDMGTGSGVGALIAARYSDKIHAVDIDSKAVACARENVENSGKMSTVQVYQGDLFEPVEGFVYDAILFSPPYLAKIPVSGAGRALYGGNNLETIDRFFFGAKQHLAPCGVIYMLCSSEGQNDMILEFIKKHKYRFTLSAMRDIILERLFLYRINPEY